jgi:VanZ family protein
MHLWALLAVAVFAKPSRQNNAIVRLADGSLQVVEPSIARTSQPPSFLAEAIRASALDVELDLRAAEADQVGPARIFTISRDYWRSNLTIGQQGADLVVRVHRPGSTSWGTPIFEVPGVFAERRWRRVMVSIEHDRIEIHVDGRPVAEAALPTGTLDTWDPGYRLALGNEVIGGRPWRGEMGRAKVSVAGRVVDLLADPEIETPARYWLWPQRVRHPQQWHRGEVILGAWHLAGFLPLGFAVAGLWRQRRPLLAAVGASFGLSLILLGVKLFLAGRHPSFHDMVIQTFGGLFGGWLALALTRR